MVKPKKIVFIVGPTAVGKSAFAMEVASQSGSHLVNCDSVQTFKSLQIGAAKPSSTDLEKVPHHLLSFVEEQGQITAGDYRKLALNLIEQQLPKNHLLFVGGSGFYFRALESGMYDVGDIPDEIQQKIEQQLAEQGLGVLYQKLKDKDPEYANKISENDQYRVLRGLCLMATQGRTMSDIRREFTENNVTLGDKYPLMKVGLSRSREKLRKKVTDRTEEMLAGGLIDEVKGLLERGLEGWAPMKSVGYREIVAHINGQLSLDEAKVQIINHTMQLAKKQMTWFRKDPSIEWFNVDGEWRQAVEYTCNWLSDWEPWTEDI